MNNYRTQLGGILSKSDANAVYELVISGDIPGKINQFFTPVHAMQVADTLYEHRNEYKSDKIIVALYKDLREYYENHTYSSLIFSEGALEPEGMCDLRSVGPLIYESLY